MKSDDCLQYLGENPVGQSPVEVQNTWTSPHAAFPQDALQDLYLFVGLLGFSFVFSNRITCSVGVISGD